MKDFRVKSFISKEVEVANEGRSRERKVAINPGMKIDRRV